MHARRFNPGDKIICHSKTSKRFNSEGIVLNYCNGANYNICRVQFSDGAKCNFYDSSLCPSVELPVAYMFTCVRCHHRTGAPIGKTVGVVFADSVSEAEDQAWSMAGGDTSCRLEVFPIDKKGQCFTVYRSEF